MILRAVLAVVMHAMPARSKVMAQTKRETVVLQDGGCT
jgi:hypothetical protein